MPYITQDRRIKIQDGIEVPRNAGELNYAITDVLTDYLTHHDESYQTYNDIVGALEAAKLEMYRRRIAPYEDGKKVVNGDVY